MADIAPKLHRISVRDGTVRAYHDSGDFTRLYHPLGLSLPSNDHFNSLLVSFSTQLSNKYLITSVIHCHPYPRQPGSGTTCLCNIAKPFVWHRNEDVGSVVGGAVR